MKRLLLLVLTLALFLPAKSQAEIYILIDQFNPEHRFPIAIADLINPKTQTSDPEGKAISDLLRKNMKLAGYFDIIPESGYQDRSANLTPESIDFSQWASTGARVFVKGAYKKKGSKVTVELRLYDPQLKTMLVGKEYTVKADQTYAAVHRFADEIMLALTGQKGIFSTKIVAVCGPAGKEQVVTMNVDGSDRQMVTNNNAMNLSPTWSPDGTKIVFTSYMKFFPELYMLQSNKDKWGKPTRLTFNNSLNITPTFSPDGQQILFASSQEGDPDLFVMNLQGEVTQKLAKNFGIDISPTYSPDGNFIAFASERAGNLHLFVTDKSGSEPKRLTYTGYQNDTPDWSPRGDKIAFVRRSGGNFNIFLMNADGSQDQQITSAGNNENPSFSPDGRYIVFKSGRDGKSNLYLMMWDGSNQMAISNEGECKTPEWSPWFTSANPEK